MVILAILIVKEDFVHKGIKFFSSYPLVAVLIEDLELEMNYLSNDVLQVFLLLGCELITWWALFIIGNFINGTLLYLIIEEDTCFTDIIHDISNCNFEQFLLSVNLRSQLRSDEFGGGIVLVQGDVVVYSDCIEEWDSEFLCGFFAHKQRGLRHYFRLRQNRVTIDVEEAKHHLRGEAVVLLVVNDETQESKSLFAFEKSINNLGNIFVRLSKFKELR